MIDIKVSVPSPTWNMARQSPGRTCTWGDCRFHFEDTLDGYDCWVVYDGLQGTETAVCDPGRVYFITGEPPSIKTYNGRFLDQFSAVVTFRGDIAHRRIIKSQPALPWWVGKRLARDAEGRHRFMDDAAIDYDSLRSFDGPGKAKLISIVTSGKKMTEGHRRRLAFVDALRNEFGGDIDIFAPGEREVVDKWDAIAPYRYHVAIENEVHPDYWTEKLADSFLGLAHPFYHGCPNAADYFPAASMTRIDIADPSGSARIMAASMDAGGPPMAPMLEARRRVLDEFNFFPVMAGICTREQASGRSKKLTLRPEGRMPMDGVLCRARAASSKLRGR